MDWRALLRFTGGNPLTITVAALLRLVDLAGADNVTLQVLPKRAGASPAMDGPFSVLTLPEPIPDFGYAEGAGGAVYIEDRESIRACIVKWGILTERALSQAESVDLINECAQAYR